MKTRRNLEEMDVIESDVKDLLPQTGIESQRSLPALACVLSSNILFELYFIAFSSFFFLLPFFGNDDER